MGGGDSAGCCSIWAASCAPGRGARWPSLGSHRAAKCWCPMTSALGRRRCPPGSVDHAPPPKPSQPQAPLRLAGARPPPPPALGPGDLRSPKRPKPDLPAGQGRAMSVGPAQPGGGDADPFSPPPTAGDNSGPALQGSSAPPPFPPRSNPHRRRPRPRRRSRCFSPHLNGPE